MSFGNLNNMLDSTIEMLNVLIGENNISLSSVHKYKNQVYNNLKKDYSGVTIDIVDEIFVRLFTSKYIMNPVIEFENGVNSFREFENSYPAIKIPSKFKKLSEHFNKLKNLPQPAQRSQEWYDYRYNRITASDMAAAIDLNPYEPVESFILKKCDPNFPFRDNATVFHGKKYEPTATMIYEHIYNTRVFEFGALPSDKFPFLGASPDGISSEYTLNNKFSERLGMMLEIKCPVTRDIHTSGKIVGDICPFYYYCQVQQQLICCELSKCDFWQCKIVEYESREQYMSDDCKSTSTTVGTTGAKIIVDDRLKKGIILEFYPKIFVPEFEGDLPEWKSKYIIPKRLDMDESQYNNWVIKMLDQYKTLYPEISKDYYFYRIIYWKLEMSHNVTIERDDVFFESKLPILHETWDKIIYYRKHLDKLSELQKIVDQRKKYIKMNTNYQIDNNFITTNKILFLDSSYDCATIFANKSPPPKSSHFNKYSQFSKPIKNDDIQEFIDDSIVCDFIDEPPANPKSMIHHLINSKPPIKHTEFTKKNSSNTITKKNQTTIKNTNDLCDFID